LGVQATGQQLLSVKSKYVKKHFAKIPLELRKKRKCMRFETWNLRGLDMPR